MARTPATEKMHQALKLVVVPYLREQGFKGSFPHFRRVSAKRIELLSFIFKSMMPGGFSVGLASRPIDGVVDHQGNIIVSPSKLSIYDGINDTLCELSPTDSLAHAFFYAPWSNSEEFFRDNAMVTSAYFEQDDGKYFRIAELIRSLIQQKANMLYETPLSELRIRAMNAFRAIKSPSDSRSDGFQG